jgi:hypothetical protein
MKWLYRQPGEVAKAMRPLFSMQVLLTSGREGNSMIKGASRSIGLLSVILLCSAVAAAEPFSVIDSFKQHVRSITSFSAAVERIQSYRNVERKSMGAMNYDKRYGSLYNWKSPGNYRFFRSDFGAYGVDLKKQHGWKTEFGTPDPEFSRQIDPLYRLVYLLSLSKSQLTYRGNSGDLLVFSMDIGNGKRQFFGFDAISSRCRFIEIADKNGHVFDKTKLYYPPNDTKIPFPVSIVITTLVGSELSVDSVVIKKPQVNKMLERELFAIPANVTWHKRISAVLPE